jgi:hypothetical protein
MYEFCDNTEPIELSMLVNDEQLIDFVLDHIAERNSDEVHPTAEHIMMWYIIKQFQLEKRESFDESDVQQKYSELLADKVLFNLNQKGLVDVDFDEKGEIIYKLSNIGKEKVKNEN